MIYNLPLRHKITAIAVTTTAIVLMLASVLFIALEVNSYRRALVLELTTSADITSTNSTAAIRFGDRAAAQETLAALGKRPNIVSASIFTPGGRLFAHYGETVTPGNGNETRAPNEVADAALWRESGTLYEMIWTLRSVDLYGPISHDGDIIGAIHIRSNLAQFFTTIKIYVGVILLMIALAVALAWLLAARLQRHVTRPIHDLLDTMRAVTDQRDYSLRVREQGRDELGAVVDGFNAMLATTEEYEGELNAARYDAEAANRMKSEFLAHMSHELRTPLNAILGFSDFMLIEPLGPLGHRKYREYTEDIRGGGRHLLGVINDILDLSKIEAGATELSEEVFDAEALINECGRLLRERALNAGVDLRIDLEPGLPNLYGDPQLLKRGLLNLISNAVKFTPAGGNVSVRTSTQPDGDFAITVIDTGIGIDPEDIAHVLTPFGQAENVLNRTHDGTGLGLPLVKSFVELHGGVLELQSVIGFGTEVSMRLPGSRVRLRSIPGTATAEMLEREAVISARKFV